MIQDFKLLLLTYIVSYSFIIKKQQGYTGIIQNILLKFEVYVVRITF